MSEPVLTKDEDIGLVQLRDLDKVEVHVIISHFGTGYLSLRNMGLLPIHCLKIDSSFVTNIQRCSQNQKIVKSIVGLAEILNLHVVADGIDTKEDCEFLMELGCNQFQGDFLSGSLSVDEIGEYIAQENIESLTNIKRITGQDKESYDLSVAHKSSSRSIHFGI